MIRTVLIANRGEIARRVMRTCRAMGIRTVAVYSDADVAAPHVAEADFAIPIGAPEPTASYLDIEKIVGAAQTANADAIHPGYGFLSENPALAKACEAAGIVFIGPPVDAIVSMGSKLESKRIMDAAGVPTLTSIEIVDGGDVEAAADEIGYPVLIKASAGGGGKGMRVVANRDELAAAVDGARREAESAFGDGTVFLETYLPAPRHIEVQIFGDTHGNVVALGERECSVQRRHQKVIEEAPSPVVTAEIRARLFDAAEAAGKAVSYVGAGTVEFLVDGEEVYFLEMNTRLQVEHPVTEMVTGLDLVRLQIEIADGASVPDRPAVDGHAIEARVYAEDPRNGFLPSTGTLHRFSVPGEVRVDSGVEDGAEVSIHYDPMLAKVIAHGKTRDDAIRRLTRSLRAASMFGVTTNTALLVRILEHEEFGAGAAHTAWLESLDVVEMSGPLPGPGDVERMAIAASLAGQARRRDAADVLTTLPSGWRNSPSQLNTDTYSYEDRTLTVGYRIADEQVTLAIDGEDRTAATLIDAKPARVRLVIDGVDHVMDVHEAGSTVHVVGSDGAVTLIRHPRLPQPERDLEPGSLLSPMPGKVVRVEAAVGQSVTAGTPLVVVEAMKMEHTIAAPADGVVSALPVTAGDQVEADQVLAVIEST